MKNLGTEFKVGLFAIVTLVVIISMFFVLGDRIIDNQETSSYYTFLSDAKGVIPKTHVKTNGVTVGKVSAVRLDKNRTRIEMEVDAAVKIPEGSKLEIRTRGLLGDVFIEIIRVQDNGKYIENGGFLPLSEDQVDMAQLISLVGSISKDIKQVTSTFSQVLGNKEGEDTLDKIVKNIEELTDETRSMIKENRGDVKRLIENLETTSATIRKAIGDRDNDINMIVSNVKESSDNLNEFSAELRSIVSGENKGRVERILAAFDDTVLEVQDTAKNFKLVSEKIEKGEGTIGKLVNDDNTITELEGAIKDLRKVLKPATKLRTKVDYHGEFRADNQSQHYFNLELRTRPDKFYLLGFTDLSEDVTTVRTKDPVVTPASGNTPRTQETETSTVEKKAIRFNLQFAKRWAFSQVRFGLFETTGGIATDFYALRDRFRLSLEAFDWDSESTIRKTAHMKAYASILFFNHLYLIGGVDDPTRYDPDTAEKVADPDTNYFLGAGVSFNDDDLKAIFGTAALFN